MELNTILMISLRELSELLNNYSLFTIGALTVGVGILFFLFLSRGKKKKQPNTTQTTALEHNVEVKLLAKRIAKLEKILAFKEEPVSVISNVPNVPNVPNASREEIRNVELEKIIETKKFHLIKKLSAKNKFNIFSL